MSAGKNPEVSNALAVRFQESESLVKYVEKVGVNPLLELVASLGVFAPYQEVTAEDLRRDLTRNIGTPYFLWDGTHIAGAFDFTVFKAVCQSEELMELTDGEMKELFELLKDSPFLERVYQIGQSSLYLPAPEQLVVPTGESGIVGISPEYVPSLGLKDTGRAALAGWVKAGLLELLKELDNQEMAEEFDNYYEALERAQAVYAAKKAESEDFKGVVFFLRHSETGMLHPYILREVWQSDELSTEEVEEISLIHGMTTGTNRHPDVFQSLEYILTNGFSAPAGTHTEGPNANLSMFEERMTGYEQPSPTTRDRYTLIFSATESVTTAEMKRQKLKGKSLSATESYLVYPQQASVQIGNVPVENISVIVWIEPKNFEERTQKEAFYRSFFGAHFEDVEYQVLAWPAR
jgi:hypothetical protein